MGLVIIRPKVNSVRLDLPTGTELGEVDNTWLLKSCLKCTSTFLGPSQITH